MKNTVKVCPDCYRTDAFSPGHIDCDKQWHEVARQHEAWARDPAHYRKPKEMAIRIELK